MANNPINNEGRDEGGGGEFFEGLGGGAACPRPHEQEAWEDDPNRPPISGSPCNVCGTVHATSGHPKCICSKCGKFLKIVWCGMCTPCTYGIYCETPGYGEEMANTVFPKYAEYLLKQREIQSKEAGDPWD
jgi:hypothetical protein